jgi:hypothetical protein
MLDTNKILNTLLRKDLNQKKVKPFFDWVLGVGVSPVEQNQFFFKSGGYSKVGNLNPNLSLNTKISARFTTSPLHPLSLNTKIPNLMFQVRMQYELADLFDRGVDLVSKTALLANHDYIRRQNILGSVVVIYAAR